MGEPNVVAHATRGTTTIFTKSLTWVHHEQKTSVAALGHATRGPKAIVTNSQT